MRNGTGGFVGVLAISALFLAGAPAAAEEFDWIMKSIAKAGDVDNGDGHYWSFRSAGKGKWEVEGAQGYTATVTSTGENKVSIDGFPDGWGANGTYAFTKKGGNCGLKSQDSFAHHLKWQCG